MKAGNAGQDHLDSSCRPVGKARRTRGSLLFALALTGAVAVGAAVYLKASGVRLGGLLTGGQAPPLAAPGRPDAWAAPLNRPGLPNLHKVGDNLYRGAQPTAEGFRELTRMGVKTVVDLRSLHSDREMIAGTPLAYEHISFKTWHAEDEDMVRFLQIVADKSKAPVFVHCRHGADRTGTACAVYRIVVQGWSKDEAIREMTQGGYGYHEAWGNLVTYIRKLDTEAIGRGAGIPAAP